jgi:hypothetical protein
MKTTSFHKIKKCGLHTSDEDHSLPKKKKCGLHTEDEDHFPSVFDIATPPIISASIR